MDEDDLASLPWQPYRAEDGLRAIQRTSRCFALGTALWGKTPDDLRRQLLAPHPEIPPGFDLADFLALLRNLKLIVALLRNPRSGLPGILRSSPDIEIGTRTFTVWELRHEVVRRAIEHLENR